MKNRSPDATCRVWQPDMPLSTLAGQRLYRVPTHLQRVSITDMDPPGASCPSVPMRYNTQDKSTVVRNQNTRRMARRILGGDMARSEHTTRGLTRTDTLAIAVICLLLLILLPVLSATPREGAFRRLCEMNLSEIGKTMLLYANDHRDALPRVGDPNTVWGPTGRWERPLWNLPQRPSRTANSASISSCFYLLVRYYELPTWLFVCRADTGTSEYVPPTLDKADPIRPLRLLWDFGSPHEAYRHCSYSYHMPYGPFPLTTARNPKLAVAADRNPWIAGPTQEPGSIHVFKPDMSPFYGTAEQAKEGNSRTHGFEGQNVLFLDGRVTFERRAYCAVDQDNIYTKSQDPKGPSPIGTAPERSTQPANEHDSVLVHDPPPSFSTW